MAMTYTTDPINVIDVDSHLTEPPGLWLDRAPAKFKNRVPRVVQNAQQPPRWIVEDGKELGLIGYSTVRADGSRIEGDLAWSEVGFEGIHKGAYDFRARLGWLDERGIRQQM